MTRSGGWRNFWRPDVQAEIDEEVAFHLQERINELIATGLAPDEARSAALGEFGDPDRVRREIRAIDDRRLNRAARQLWWRDWGADCRWAARALRRTPIVTLTIVLTLALGLGANGAIFALLDAVYLRQPAGVAAPEQVHRVWFQMSFRNAGDGPVYWPGFSYPDFRGIASAIGDRVPVAIYRQDNAVPLSGEQGAPTIAVTYADSGYFPLLGVAPLRGRAFSAEELRLGSTTPVVIVSDRFWHQHFGAAPGVLGEVLRIGAREYQVVGVMPPAFQGIDLHVTDVWVPLGFLGRSPGWWDDGNTNGLNILLRANTDAGLAEIIARTTATLRQTRRGADSLALASLGGLIAARGPGTASQELQLTLRLAGVAAIVLLIAAANVANLLLARAAQRSREIAVRVALGVSRGRLIRLLMTETALLACLAGIASLLVAQWGGTLLRRVLLPDVIWSAPPVTWSVAGATLLLALLAGAITGLAPALLRGTGPAQVLRSTGRGGTVRGGGLRRGLTALQAALSVVLLAGAALFWTSLRRVEQRDIGFDASQLLFADARGSDPATRAQRLEEAATRLRAIPGVETVALASLAPLEGISFTTFHADGSREPAKTWAGIYTTVSAGYFNTTGMQLLQGSDFPASASAAPEVIVNQAMATLLWAEERPLGRCLRFEGSGDCWSVRGITETAMMDQLLEKPEPQVYFSAARRPPDIAGVHRLIIRTSVGASAPVAPIRAVLGEIFPGARPWVMPFRESLDPQYRPWRLGATLFALFGLLAALVAAVGIYSMVAYHVQQRTREFGIRFALGATNSQVLRLVLGDGLRTVAVGAAIGVGLSLLLGRLVAALLYDVEPGNPLILAAVVAALLGVALIASCGPAWRATRLDPARTLQAE